MLRTTAPLIGALYVSRFWVGEGCLSDRTEPVDVPHASEVCSREFSKRDSASTSTCWQSTASPPRLSVSTRGTANQSASWPVAKGHREVTSTQWRTPRAFFQRQAPSMTDVPPLSYSAHSLSVNTRDRNSSPMRSLRPPYNQPMERTPPCCALRRRSSAR